MVCGLVLVGVGHVGDIDMQSMSLGVCRLWASEANTMLERIDTWIILVLWQIELHCGGLCPCNKFCCATQAMWVNQ